MTKRNPREAICSRCDGSGAVPYVNNIEALLYLLGGRRYSDLRPTGTGPCPQCDGHREATR